MSLATLYMPYKHRFEPIVRIGEYVAVPVGRERLEFYRVVYIEPIPPLTVALTVDAGSKIDYDSKDLKLYDNELGQWRVWVADPAAVKVYFPPAIPKFSNRDGAVAITPLAALRDQLVEFYTKADKVPRFEVYNPLEEQLLVRLVFWGYKYSVDRVEERPERYTVFPVYSANYVVGGEARG